MDINATLFGQMLSFLVFVWFTAKFLWPHITKTLEDRRRQIADGLAAAEKGIKQLEIAGDEARHVLARAKEKGHEILENANKQAESILEAAKVKAQEEKQDILASGRLQLEQELNAAKGYLQQKLAGLVVSGVEQIINKTIKVEDHKAILDGLTESMQR